MGDREPGVAPAFRRRGVGGELLRELSRRAENEAAQPFCWRSANRTGRPDSFTKSIGFREESYRRAYYREPVEDAILYALRFDR